MKIKGQIAVEYMLLIGFVLVALIPIVYYSANRSNLELQGSQANDAAETIAKEADKISLYGAGSQSYVWVSIPSGVKETSLDKNEVRIVISAFGNQTEFAYPVIANLTGEIPKNQGRHKIRLSVLDNMTIRIWE